MIKKLLISLNSSAVINCIHSKNWALFKHFEGTEDVMI